MSESGHTLFSCHNLRVDVSGRNLVDALEFDVGRGEMLAVLGQNGSGKSLTMHTLAGLRQPSSGHGMVGLRHQLRIFKRTSINTIRASQFNV